MHKFSHVDISLAVKRAVERETGIRINTIGFVYGNLKPDISIPLLRIPHFMHKSLQFVLSEITELLKYDVNKISGCSMEFSKRLGIVIHYLSDFFCHVHDSEYHGSMIRHYFYEVKLFIYSRLNRHMFASFRYTRYPILSITQASILNSVEKLHAKYRSKSPSFDRDIIYTLRMCTSLTMSILAFCTSKKEAAA